MLQLRLTVSAHAEPEAQGVADTQDQEAAAGREAAGLGFGTIGEVLRAHGGDIRRNGQAFDVILPLAEGSGSR